MGKEGVPGGCRGELRVGGCVVQPGWMSLGRLAGGDSLLRMYAANCLGMSMAPVDDQ